MPNSYSKGSSNRDSTNIKPAGIKLQGLRNSKYNPGLDLKKRPEPIKEETKPSVDQTDIERGTADDERSVGESEDAILSSEEEEQYRIDPREHWRRISLAVEEESSMRGARIATPEQDRGRLSRVSTRSSDAVGVVQ